MQKVAYNSSDSPLVIDEEGHTLGGREWGPVESTEDSVKEAVTAKTLIIIKDVGEEPVKEAAAAVAEVEAATDQPAKSRRSPKES